MVSGGWGARAVTSIVIWSHPLDSGKGSMRRARVRRGRKDKIVSVIEKDDAACPAHWHDPSTQVQPVPDGA